MDSRNALLSSGGIRRHSTDCQLVAPDVPHHRPQRLETAFRLARQARHTAPVSPLCPGVLTSRRFQTTYLQPRNLCVSLPLPYLNVISHVRFLAASIDGINNPGYLNGQKRTLDTEIKLPARRTVATGFNPTSGLAHRTLSPYVNTVAWSRVRERTEWLHRRHPQT